MKTLKIFCILLFTSLSYTAAEAQIDTTTYHLTIEQQPVNITGKSTRGMTINGSIPGPTLRFKKGGYAVIRVTNRMDVETSVHWHGLLLPNYYDGVPYLTTPPIAPGETLQYEFPLKQAGTYWYHSHTMLQEQRGVYGSIVIEPQEKTIDYDRDLVLVFSDWTDEKPANVLRNLKRGNEWYNIRKGTATPLNRVIARGAFGAQLNFWKQRMEGADIADIYYPAFLVNGEMTREYPDFKPGEKIRLRIINAAASTSFWLTFGGEDPVLVAADGLDVVPVTHNKTFIAIAETYDYIVEVPANGKLEVRATAQDGSGQTAAFLGNGPTLSAPYVPRPDKIGMMMQMAKMNMKMGAPALKFRPGRDNRFQMKDKYGMQMEGMDHSPAKMQQDEMEQMPGMDHQMDHPKDTMPMPEKGKTSQMQMQESHQHQDTMPMPDMDRKEGMDSAGMQMEGMPGMNMFAEYNYDYLRSPEPTAFADTTPVKEILLNLTGNMNRYIWSMNGVALSETDKIKIKGDQVTRIRLNNLTMMHHPMHLHGHFFRVLNKNGTYSPLKHTVNVPPMEEVTIEFYGNEYGDWFFHCHILYHMMGGMARVFSYDTPRDPRMTNFPVKKLIHETNRFYQWGMIDAGSHMSALNLTASNIRNQFNLSAEFGYNKNLEAEFTYQYYLYDYLSVFGGVNLENANRNSLDTLNTVAVAGIRWLTPYLFSLDLRVDHQLRPRIGIGRSVMLFPKFSIFGYYEYQADFGWVGNEGREGRYSSEIVWNAGAEFLLSRNFSLMASYDNRFGAGGGISVRF